MTDESLESTADEPYQPTDFERLEEFAHNRGYRRRMALAVFLVGCVPALLIVLVTQGRNGSLPLIAGVLVIGPTLTLLLWTLRDRDAQEARELGMWLRVVRRAGDSGGAARLRRELPEIPPDEELDRISLRDTATEYREKIEPLIASPGILSFRITVYRYWYVIGAVAVTVVAAVALVVFSPSIG
jgi:hypothetical protein